MMTPYDKCEITCRLGINAFWCTRNLVPIPIIHYYSIFRGSGGGCVPSVLVHYILLHFPFKDMLK